MLRSVVAVYNANVIQLLVKQRKVGNFYLVYALFGVEFGTYRVERVLVREA